MRIYQYNKGVDIQSKNLEAYYLNINGKILENSIYTIKKRHIANGDIYIGQFPSSENCYTIKDINKNEYILTESEIERYFTVCEYSK